MRGLTIENSVFSSVTVVTSSVQSSRYFLRIFRTYVVSTHQVLPCIISLEDLEPIYWGSRNKTTQKCFLSNKHKALLLKTLWKVQLHGRYDSQKCQLLPWEIKFKMWGVGPSRNSVTCWGRQVSLLKRGWCRIGEAGTVPLFFIILQFSDISCVCVCVCGGGGGLSKSPFITFRIFSLLS